MQWIRSVVLLRLAAAASLLAVLGPARGQCELFPGRGYAVASTASIAVGDVDGDGKVDVATSGPGFLRGLSDGRFAAASFGNVGAAAAEVCLADLDLDGRPDLVVTTTSGLSVCMNQGGAWGPRVDYTLSQFVGAHLALGDVTGDGLPDVALVLENSGSAALLRGLGGGRLAAAVVTAIPGGPHRQAVVADLDGDGRGELIVASNTGVNVLSAEANGAFTSRRNFPTAFGAAGVAVGDLDGDGRPDVAAATVSDAITLLLNFRAGAFERRLDVPTGVVTSGVACADMDGDGRVDLAAFSTPLNAAFVCLHGDGDGFVRGDLAPTSRQPVSFAVADVNGDGRPEVLVGCGNRDDLGVLVNDGAGALIGRRPDRLDATWNGMIAADLDADGRPDLAMWSASRGAVDLLFNTPGGLLPLPPIRVAASPLELQAADLNGDGYPDLVTWSRSPRSYSVVLSTGPRTYAPAVTTAVSASLNAVRLADVNHDGKVDLALIAGNAVDLRLGDGAGGFTPWATVAGAQDVDALVQDLDGDGWPEIVLVSSITGRMDVYHGDGAGGFTGPASYPVPTAPRALRAGDLNGDGVADLAVLGSNAVAEYVGLGGAVFAAPRSLVLSGAQSTLALADVDGDGRLDIVAGLDLANLAGVLINDGAGGFLPPAAFMIGSTPRSIIAADLDADGLTDLASVSVTGLAVLPGISRPAVLSGPADAITCPGEPAALEFRARAGAPSTRRWEARDAGDLAVWRPLEEGENPGVGLFAGVSTAGLRVLRLDVPSAQVRGLVSGPCGESVSPPATVTRCCPADFNQDGFADFFDYSEYVECFEAGACPGRGADMNGDGFADFFDYLDFVAAFEAGC